MTIERQTDEAELIERLQGMTKRQRTQIQALQDRAWRLSKMNRQLIERAAKLPVLWSDKAGEASVLAHCQYTKICFSLYWRKR